MAWSSDGGCAEMAEIVSSRTPEGQPNHCPVCNADVSVDPSSIFGDAPCPVCGNLLWFVRSNTGRLLFERESTESLREAVVRLIAEQLGVDPKRIESDRALLNNINADSLDIVELVMELEEEFDL
jgi:hypothetical protein